MKSLGIVGGFGFIGTNCTLRLKEAGYNVTVIDNFSFSDKKNIPLNVKYIEKGYENLTEHELNFFDEIVFVACSNIIYSVDYPIETIRNNAINFYDFINKFKGKIVFTSTSSKYGNAKKYPITEETEINVSNFYDSSKYIAELFLKNRGNQTTLVLTNTYGKYQRVENPYCGVVSRMIDRVEKGLPIEIFGNGNSTRDYNHVSDVCEAILLAVEKEPLNTSINLGTGVETNSKQLATIISEAFNVPTKFTYVPERKIDGIKRRCLDNSKAKELLGWTPKTDLKTGIQKTIDWIKSQR